MSQVLFLGICQYLGPTGGVNRARKGLGRGPTGGVNRARKGLRADGLMVELNEQVRDWAGGLQRELNGGRDENKQSKGWGHRRLVEFGGGGGGRI